MNLARDYASTRPAAIRVNYGLQRHAGGGMAVRTIACLPALIGAWRDAAGGVVLSTADFYGFDHKTLERPDLIRGQPRTINQSALGDALTSARPPVKAIYVYNNNPVAVCPDSNKVIAGFSRDRPVHGRARRVPDRHDRLRRHRAAGDDAARALRRAQVLRPPVRPGATIPAIAPLGEAKPNIEVFRLLAKRMGFEEACFDDTDEEVCRQALRSEQPRMRGIDWETVKEQGWQRLAVPERYAPFAEGGLSHALRQMRVLQRNGGETWGSTRCPPTRRRARTSCRRPRWRSAIRSPSFRRRAAIS